MHADDHLARVCLRLISDEVLMSKYSAALENKHSQFESMHDKDIVTGLTELLRYAIRYWSDHVQYYEEAEDTKQLNTLLKEFLRSMNDSKTSCKQWYKIMLSISEKLADIHTWALRFRLEKLIELLSCSTALFVICHFSFYRVLLSW